MGLVAPRHVGSSQTRARTRVPCIGRQILNHCATREAQEVICSFWTVKFLVPMLVSCGCHNTLSQTWWLKTTEMYSLTVLEDRSVKSRCRQGHTLSGGSWGDYICSLFQLLVVPGVPQLVAVSFQSLPLWSPFSSSSLCVSHLSPVTEFQAHLGNPAWSPYLDILNLITSAKTLFPNKVTFTASRYLDMHMCFEGTII